MWNKRKSTDNVIAVKPMPYLHTVIEGALDLTCALSGHTVITDVGKLASETARRQKGESGKKLRSQ